MPSAHVQDSPSAPARGWRTWPLLGWLREQYVARAGNWSARQARREARRSPGSLGAALDAVSLRWPDPGTEAASGRPVFLLAAGWRAGSTWVQRALMSSGTIVVWGEPYTRANLVQSLAGQLLPFSEDWPPERWVVAKPDPGALAETWSANTYPAFEHLAAAHRAFLVRLFQTPAAAAGIPRWGFKETRLGIEEARYLRWLFPDAGLVFLVRSPYEAYRSYRRWGAWHLRWPDQLVATPADFGRMWRRLTEGFLAGHGRVGAHLVRYETLLRDPGHWDALAAYLDLDLSRAATVADIASEARGAARPKPRVPRGEWRLLEREVGELASRLGYAPPS